MAAQLKSASLVSMYVAFEDQDFLGDFFLIGTFFYTDARAHAYYMCLV